MALPVNIDDLVNARTIESTRLEFKKGWNPEEVIRSTCAFANDIRSEGGGFIFIGIEEQDGAPILPPVGLNQNQIEPITKEFLNLCFKIQPNIFPGIEGVQYMGKWIIAIWITTGEERSYNAPSTLGEKAQRRIYVRPIAATIPATPELERQLRELSTFKYFDDRMNTRAKVEDMDLGLIQSYLQEVKSNLYGESLKLSLEEVAQKMQIVRGPKENTRPLNVGLLMFSKEPHKFFEGCKTNLVVLKDESGNIEYDKIFTGPVHLQIREIMNYLNTNIIKQYINKLPSKAEANKFYNYPYQALEEAVVNALYHRSYENPTPNEIRIYNAYKKGTDQIYDTRRIEILSYPGPLPPIDETALSQLKISARNYRNIKLGDWLKNIKLAEKYATGIPTMRDSMSSNGSPLPILSTDADKSYFLAVIPIHPDTPLEIDSNSELPRVVLSNNQQKILEFLLKEPNLEKELTEKVDFELKPEIEFLSSKGLISSKKAGEALLFYITEMGADSLKRSF